MSDSGYYPPPADRRVKIPHLVFGLLFAGIVGIWVLGTADLISGEHLAVLAPAVLILAGVVGLVASLASTRNRSRSRSRAVAPAASTGATDQTPSQTYDQHDDTEEIR